MFIVFYKLKITFNNVVKTNLTVSNDPDLIFSCNVTIPERKFEMILCKFFISL